MSTTSPDRPTRTLLPGSRGIASEIPRLLVASLLLVLTGCTTPQTRAHEKKAAFGRLPPTDQKLVLSGEVRPGLNQDAVYIAWGTPTGVCPAGPTQGPLDAWVYAHTFYGTGGGYFGAPRGLVYFAQKHRYLYDGNDYYETPVYLRGFGPVSTDVPYHRALFDHGRLVSFASLQSGSAPTPGDKRNP